ncbi:MAG: cell division protein FtsL [Pseudomonadota bacterium]
MTRLTLAVLVAAVIASGMLVSRTAYQVRGFHGELETLRKKRDAALVEQGQLLLERSAVASLTLTDAKARQTLAMHVPAEVIEVAAQTPVREPVR